MLLMQEIMKGSMSLVFCLRSSTNSLYATALSSWPMVVPALIYLLMNILGFTALSIIDAGLFSMISQLKLLATAFAACSFLGKTITSLQWRSLFLMTVGVLLLSHETTQLKSAKYRPIFLLGIACASGDVILSGAVSVYIEKVLKEQHEVSLWERNLQLAFCSIPVYAVLEISTGGELSALAEHFSSVSWLLAVVGSLGGLLVAYCLKYLDAIQKTIATACSAIVTVYLNHLLFGGLLTFPVIVAMIVLLAGLVNYYDFGNEISSSHSKLPYLPIQRQTLLHQLHNGCDVTCEACVS